MGVGSRSVDWQAVRRARVPRWVLLVWLWLNVPATLFVQLVCNPDDPDGWCAPAAPIAWFISDLFPLTLYMFFPRALPEAVPWLASLLATAGCHALILRWLPAQIGLARFLWLLVGWAVLSVVTFGAALFLPVEWIMLGERA